MVFIVGYFICWISKVEFLEQSYIVYKVLLKQLDIRHVVAVSASRRCGLWQLFFDSKKKLRARIDLTLHLSAEWSHVENICITVSGCCFMKKIFQIYHLDIFYFPRGCDDVTKYFRKKNFIVFWLSFDCWNSSES